MRIGFGIRAIGLFCVSLPIFTAGAVSAKASSELPTKITPGWLRTEIGANGAKAVVDRLFDADRYDEVSRAVAKGERAWLDLVPLVAGGTDASTSEDLMIALALALPRNAEGVLKASKLAGLAVGLICSAPFYETMQVDTPHYLRTATRAVEHVRGEALLGVRSECLSALKNTPPD
jgi:hypothetical protein